jgi:hypothetical protein
MGSPGALWSSSLSLRQPRPAPRRSRCQPGGASIGCSATIAQQQPPQQQGGRSSRGIGAARVAIEYSDAYKMRAKIHKVASLATIPLFAAEGIVDKSCTTRASTSSPPAH